MNVDDHRTDAASAIREGRPSDLDGLAALWERSVRATHDFLSENDITTLRPEVCRALAAPGLWVIERDGGAAGFMILDGAMIEALFIDPDHRSGGLGTRLINHARRLCADARSLRVDVNEQNPAALAFYRARGFAVTGRSPLDGTGRPFPLLHLVLVLA